MRESCVQNQHSACSNRPRPLATSPGPRVLLQRTEEDKWWHPLDILTLETATKPHELIAFLREQRRRKRVVKGRGGNAQ